mmetsp:Transcript_35788/g.52524  ORF Transcript_35788/g.52524 Transcript_35788/m.52524 type:complete len:94 (-) Transcript_35788:191-472(-)
MFDVIQHFSSLAPPNLGSAAYPYGLRKDTSYDDEASFIAYPVGNETPAGCADGFTINYGAQSQGVGTAIADEGFASCGHTPHNNQAVAVGGFN